MQLEKLIYNHVHEKSVRNHEHPTLLSQLCMNSNDWPCTKIHQSAEHNMQDLESTVDEADLLISMHVFHCIQLGFKNFVQANSISVKQAHIKICCLQVKV